jgi:hypothetical protein
MSGMFPRVTVIADHRVSRMAVGGGPRACTNVCYILDHQSLNATHGKIHIKDKNLIRLENLPEQICRGDGIGPSSAWAEAEG